MTVQGNLPNPQGNLHMSMQQMGQAENPSVTCGLEPLTVSGSQNFKP